MRTINTVLRDRILAEAEEAETQGLTKIASVLTDQLEINPVRDSEESYTYSSEDFERDVEASLWNVIVRTADFHGTAFSSEKAQEIVEFYSKEILKDVRASLHAEHGVGAYEKSLPGQVRESVILEVDID